MTLHAERIGKAQCHLAAVGVGNFRSVCNGFLCLWRIPQIAFQIGHFRLSDQIRVHIAPVQFGARAQVGHHGALCVRRYQHKAARGGLTPRRRRSIELHAARADVMPENLPQLVVPHPADIGPLAAQRRQTRRRIRRRPAGHFLGRAHFGIDRFGLALVDQDHDSLVEAVGRQKGIIHARQHIDNRVADTDNVQFCFTHLRLRGTHLKISSGL